MPKCLNCGAEKIQKVVGGNGFGAVARNIFSCPNGCDSSSKPSGWTACSESEEKHKHQEKENSFSQIPGWKSPWQD